MKPLVQPWLSCYVQSKLSHPPQHASVFPVPLLADIELERPRRAVLSGSVAGLRSEPAGPARAPPQGFLLPPIAVQSPSERPGVQHRAGTLGAARAGWLHDWCPVQNENTSPCSRTVLLKVIKYKKLFPFFCGLSLLTCHNVFICYLMLCSLGHGDTGGACANRHGCPGPAMTWHPRTHTHGSLAAGTPPMSHQNSVLCPGWEQGS